MSKKLLQGLVLILVGMVMLGGVSCAKRAVEPRPMPDHRTPPDPGRTEIASTRINVSSDRKDPLVGRAGVGEGASLTYTYSYTYSYTEVSCHK